MNDREHYEQLWRQKRGLESYRPKPRDWFHRYILDHFFNPNVNSRHDVAKRLLGRGERFLDLGCWGGDSAQTIGVQDRYRFVVGLDLPLESGIQTRKKGFHAILSNLNHGALPFKKDVFDGVLCLAVLAQVFDPIQLVSEIHRVLAPGGEVVISVPNVASFSNRFRILAGRVPVTSLDPGWNGGQLHSFTLYDVTRLLEANGFAVLEKRGTGGLIWLRQWWLSLLSGDLVLKCRKAE
jgi:SAM-dependent methyltransferase